MAQSQPAKGKSNGGRSERNRASGREASASTPRERDEIYGLVSVLCHALQGSQTYGEDIQDAERAGDDDLLSFFSACQDEEDQRTLRARGLLAARLGEDDEDEEGDEGRRARGTRGGPISARPESATAPGASRRRCAASSP